MRLDGILRLFARVLAILAATSVPVTWAEGQDAEALFESLYGADVAKVTRTRDKADDVALAARLLEAAGGRDIQPALAAVLCRKAIDLGSSHPDGYDTAVDAADRMIEVAPEKAAEGYERLIDLREQQHRAAKGLDKIGAAETLIETLLMAADARLDGGEANEALGLMRQASRLARAIRCDRQEEIQARMDRATARLKAERQAEAYEKKLGATPDDTTTRNALVCLCVGELDDPERALKHLNDACQDDLKKYVPAAAKGVDAAPELACMDLGEWYRGLAAEASDAAKIALLSRARAYYERFLGLHEAEDLARNRATLALKKVEADLAELAAVTETRVVGPGRWVDLLPLVDIEEDAEDIIGDLKGTCVWHRGGLRMHNKRVAMPCIPEGDYQVRVTFMSVLGPPVVCIPIGPRPGSVRWYCDREYADIAGSAELQKGHPAVIVAGQDQTAEVTVRVRGTAADIVVLFDGKPHLRLQGPATRASGGFVLREAKRVGYGACGGPSVLKRYRLRMLTGKALLLRPLRKEAGKGRAAKNDKATLVPNPGFEEIVEGRPANRTQWAEWGAWSWGGQYELAPETRSEYVHSGKRSARIRCTGEKGRIGIITPRVPAAEGVKTYTFTVWARGEGENELFVNFEEDARGELRKRIGPDWEKVTVTGTLKPDGKAFRVFLYATGKGTLWLDDAAVEPVRQ